MRQFRFLWCVGTTRLPIPVAKHPDICYDKGQTESVGCPLRVQERTLDERLRLLNLVGQTPMGGPDATRRSVDEHMEM